MKIKAFITHKLKESFSDCQDRFSINHDTKSIALADGMSESWHQKIWAQLLVNTFANNIDWVPTIASVKELSSEWLNEVLKFIQKLKDEGAPENIIIRNENCLAECRSAGSTFVGIRFSDYDWNGDVLGDSCLIEWDGKEAVFYTSQNLDSFGSHPDYFDSDYRKEGRGVPRQINGTLKPGSCVFLVSDPFSDFLLKRKKEGNITSFIAQIIELSSHESFEALVDKWRNEGMHNDDTTLIIIEPDETKDLNSEHEDDLQMMINSEQAELDAKSQQEKDNEKNTSVDTTSLIEKGNIEEEKPDGDRDNNPNVGVVSLSATKPDNKCDSSLARGNQLPNNENDEGKSINISEQFKIDFLKNLNEEFAKRKSNNVLKKHLNRMIKQNQEDFLRSRNIRIYFEKAFDKTLKKYEIRIKI